MTIYTLTLKLSFFGTSENGIPEWDQIRHRLAGLGIEVIEPPKAVQEIEE